MLRFTCLIFMFFAFTGFCKSQTVSADATAKTSSNRSNYNQTIKSSPAYAELLLRKTEREAQLEELLLDYTDEFPKVKELRFEMEALQKQMDKISAVSAADAPKLSIALGKLLIRESELEVDLWSLLKQYNADYPDVKRAKRKVEVYNKAIKEILP